MTEVVPACAGEMLVLVGTRKGAFVLSGDQSRNKWPETSGRFRAHTARAATSITLSTGT